MRSMKKKMRAETASIAIGVMMYIQGTFWTPYRFTKSASAPSLPTQSAPTITVRRKYRNNASAHSPRRRGIASRSRRLMVEVWRAESRVRLFLGGRALRVHAAETAAGVDELE